MHAAADDVASGRLEEDAAAATLERAIPKLFAPWSASAVASVGAVALRCVAGDRTAEH